MQFLTQETSLVHRSKFNAAHKGNAFLFETSKSHIRWLTESTSILKLIIWRTIRQTWKVFGLLGVPQTISWMSHGKLLANFPNIPLYLYAIVFLLVSLGNAIGYIRRIRHTYAKQTSIAKELNRHIGRGEELKGFCDNGKQIDGKLILEWWSRAKQRCKEYGATWASEYDKDDETLNDDPHARALWIKTRLYKMDGFIER